MTNRRSFRPFVSMVALTVPLLTLELRAQSNVGVNVVEVVDNRISEGVMLGGVEIYAELTGSGLDKASAARLLVKEAKDDRGNDLKTKADPPEFQGRDVNAGRMSISLKQPPRDASSIRVKGTIELFTPARDPNAIIKIDNALAKLDAPLSAKKLKDAKLSITPLSPVGYAEMKKKQKITEADIERLRKEAKEKGASDEELELAIGFARAMNEMDAGPLPDGTVVLSGLAKDFDRIHKIELLDGGGNPIHIGGQQKSTRGDNVLVLLHPSEAPPANASLRLTLLTDKSKMSVPFELKNVQLP